MEYNNYYPAQNTGHPSNIQSNPHAGPQMQQQPPPPPPGQGGQMMHSPLPQQNIRQAMPPGPPNHHQQMQQQQQPPPHAAHHSQQMSSQQQQQHHSNYQPMQGHPAGGVQVSHSSSPLAPPHQHPHHQPQMSTLPPTSMSSQHIHPQSPHHHGIPPPPPPQMHMQQQQQQSMIRPQLGPSMMNHSQPGVPQPVHHQQQSFFGGNPIQQSNIHHYNQQNLHHSHHHHNHPHQPPPMMHHGPTLGPSPHVHPPQSIGRNSPYYQSILQTEFRIIELNRRLQNRPPMYRPTASPLPTTYDESIWWERFASDFFEDDATLTLRILEDKPVEYTIGRTLIPRFFRTYFDGGVIDLSINLRNPKEAYLHPQMITLDCDQAYIVTNHIFRHPAIATNPNIAVVHTEGHLMLDFVSNSFDTLSIKSWRFYAKRSHEYLDRSLLANIGMNPDYLPDPITRHGLTKSTISYLKMCMIMEPMQDLMYQHKQTKLKASECLTKLLMERFKFRPSDDMRATTNKRRKRKTSAVPAITGPGPKKSKANMNAVMNNNSNMGNNIIMPNPGAPPSFSLASQDVMVVGEPSMMGGDFGDDNERMITRLENTQYDPSASTPANMDEQDGMCVATNDSLTNSTSGLNPDNHSMSPSAIQQRQQVLQPQQEQEQQLQQQQLTPPMPPQGPSQDPPQSQQIQVQAKQEPQSEQALSPSQLLHQQQPDLQYQMQIAQELPDDVMHQNNDQRGQAVASDSNSQVQLEEKIPESNYNSTSDSNNLTIPQQEQEQVQNQELQVEQQQPNTSMDLDQTHNCVQDIKVENHGSNQADLVEYSAEEKSVADEQAAQPKEQQTSTESKTNSISKPIVESDSLLGADSNDQTDNHANSLPEINEETSPATQLPCSTATASSTIEQPQPVDNGVA